MSTKAELRALTGLRVVAALAVVLYHYAAFFAAPVGWGGLVERGAIGVDFFFLLSGFILAYTYTRDDGSFRGTYRAFWVARIARIYPIYIVGLALDLAPFLGRHHGVKGDIASGLLHPLLLQSWVPFVIDAKSLNPPSWSLSCEAFFYLLFPALLLALAPLPWRWLVGMLALCWGVFAFIPLTAITLAEHHGHPVLWWQDYILEYNPTLRLPEFAAGIALGTLWMRRKVYAPVWAPLRNLPRDALVLIVVAALCVLATIPVMLPLAFPLGAIVGPPMGLLIVLLASGRGQIAWFFATRPLVWLGEISYGVYILHWPIWWWTAHSAGRILHLSASSPLLLAVYLLALVVTAGASYRWLETPARHAIRARWSEPQARAREARSMVAPSG